MSPPLPLARQVAGPDDGPCIVLLHGFALTHRIWGAQVAALAHAGYRVIAPDLRGHGESPGRDEPATMPRCARDVLAMLDELKVERATICGMSLGGYVALEMLHQSPARIEGFVLSGARADADEPGQREGRLQLARSLEGPGDRRLGGRLLSSYFSGATLARRPELLTTVRELVHSQKSERLVHALQGIVEREARFDALAAYAGPSLFLVGRDDTHTPVAKSEAMARISNRGELVVLEDTGHLAPVENTELWNNVLLEWLAKNSTRR